MIRQLTFDGFIATPTLELRQYKNDSTQSKISSFEIAALLTFFIGCSKKITLVRFLYQLNFEYNLSYLSDDS